MFFFYVHGSEDRESMSIIVQQDETIYSLLYFCKLLYMFRLITSPIVRNTCKLLLQHLALVEPYLLPSTVVEQSELLFRLHHDSGR